MSSIPRVKAVQGLLRLVYEDGTVAAMMTPIEELSSYNEANKDQPVSLDAVLDKVRDINEAISADLGRVGGVDAIYEQAKQEAQERREDAHQRAAAARKLHSEQGMRHDVGKGRPVGRLQIPPPDNHENYNPFRNPDEEHEDADEG